MKLIRAVIREERVPFVKKALEDEGIFGMTVKEVQGRGEQKGLSLQYRGGILAIELLPKVSIDIFVRPEREEAVIQAIMKGARTGKIGDGRIFVMPAGESVRVRTGDVEA
jgi:nitrogen regulatory protein P-II 1